MEAGINSRLLSVILSVLLVSGCQTSEVPDPPPVVDLADSGCSALAKAAFPDTEFQTIEKVAAGGFISPNAEPFGPPPDFSDLPEFCRVAGSLKPTADSDIRFELWMPVEGWNGRFMQTGNGGAAGSIVYGSMIMPLTRGYAVAHTDTGHRGQGGEFMWAQGQPEKLIDYQYRAVRELTLTGKAITTAYYGRAIEQSYWLGCSTGGRQGLKEAQRYPEDYDAIIAGAPANNWSPLMALATHIERNLGPAGLNPAKVGILTDAAIAACDAEDGIVDHVIAQPESCKFDPGVLQCTGADEASCLTAVEVAAARRIYGGVVNGNGEVIMPGTGPGSEAEWAGYASPGFRIGSSYFRHVIKKDPSWQASDFNVDTDYVLAERQDDGAAKAMDPDLSQFVASGGKLLIYHGTTDGLIPYRNSETYYNSVVDKLGADRVRDHVKLYMVPGMDHCAGGKGAYQVDWLTAMEQWVEEGKTPGRLLARHPPNPEKALRGFSRPVCAYPAAATYSGTGDQTSEGSYICR